MTRQLTFRGSDRLLVFAPHPDDETLATGELIQVARAAGAAVRVVFATDGDNNPWPQRWCERRWHIGPAERERWGRRRRGEAEAALARLGVATRDQYRRGHCIRGGDHARSERRGVHRGLRYQQLRQRQNSDAAMTMNAGR